MVFLINPEQHFNQTPDGLDNLTHGLQKTELVVPGCSLLCRQLPPGATASLLIGSSPESRPSQQPRRKWQAVACNSMQLVVSVKEALEKKRGLDWMILILNLDFDLFSSFYSK